MKSARVLVGFLFALILPVSLLAAPPPDKAPCQALDPETKENVSDALGLAHFAPGQISQDVRDQLCGPKNSAAAFGARNRYRLEDLLAHPDPLAPDHTELYDTLIKFSKTSSAHQAYVLSDFIADDRSKGFTPLPVAANLQFPKDNEVDPRSQFGWYYVVGNGTGEDGKRYGVLLMLYRTALLSTPVANHFGLSETENQTVDMQLAITREGDRTYQARPTLVAGTSGLIELKPDTFYMTQGTVTGVTSPENGSVTPMRVRARGLDRGVTPAAELEIDLTFSAAKPYLFQGANGCLPCCSQIGTLYYSIPLLTLDTNASSIKLKGQTIHLDDAAFWLDHQRGTLGSVRNDALRAFSALQPTAPGGWDFFVAQFAGNRQMTFVGFHSAANAQFYNQTGPEPPAGVMTVPVHGKYMDANAVQIDARGTLRVTEWVKSTTSPDPSDYTVTNTWYPNKWEFVFGPEVPADIRTFSMRPLVTTGSALFFASGHHYQEAPVDILNAGGDVVGSGYAEATAYVDTVKSNLRNRLRLAGLPDSDKMIELVKTRNTASPALLAECATYAAAHQVEIAIELSMCSGFD